MPGKILLVDDDLDLLELYELYLRMHGNEVRSACGGRVALETVGEWSPDVALLDVRMPGMDGFELIRTLRAEGHAFPICIYTAYDTSEATRAALELGVADLVFKPSPPAVVLARLEMAMQDAAGRGAAVPALDAAKRDAAVPALDAAKRDAAVPALDAAKAACL
jgi:two-component system OmpR family response regulator